jgi:hypothetical protein
MIGARILLHPQQDKLLSDRRYQSPGGIPAPRTAHVLDWRHAIVSEHIILFAGLPVRKPSTDMQFAPLGWAIYHKFLYQSIHAAILSIRLHR